MKVETRKQSGHKGILLTGAALVCALLFVMASAQMNTAHAATAQVKAPVALSKASITTYKTVYCTGAQCYAGVSITYQNKKLVKGTDYTVSYKNNIYPGTAKVTIKGKGNFKGQITRSFTIKKRNIASAFIKVSRTYKWAYTGKVIKPAVSLSIYGNKLRAGTDYSVSYFNNVKVGTGTITIKGKGYFFTGERPVTFLIRYSLAKYGKMTLARTSMPYIGAGRTPYAWVYYNGKLLVKNQDYTLTYKNNVGSTLKNTTATITATGMGNYAFSISRTYTITSDGGKIVDVSEHQAEVSWKDVARRVDGAVLRSYVTVDNKGSGRADYYYDQNAAVCEKYGVRYGAYGYLNINTQAGAKTQAKKLWNASFANGHEPLYIVLDIEAANMKQYGTKVATFAQVAAQQIRDCATEAGYDYIKVGVYIANHLYSTFGFNTSAGRAIVLDDFDFVWIPTYGTNSGSVPTLFAPTYAFDMWQYTSAGSLYGIKGNCDLNLIRRSGPHAHGMGWYRTR